MRDVSGRERNGVEAARLDAAEKTNDRFCARTRQLHVARDIVVAVPKGDDDELP
jgi:hypothetical protein